MKHFPVTSQPLKSRTPKSSRRRGVILTLQGRQRLRSAIREAEQQTSPDRKYSNEKLGEIAKLDTSTVSKVLHADEKVDRRTLEIFFEAFSLELRQDDYCCPEEGGKVEGQSVQGMEKPRVALNEAADVSFFYGREDVLTTLEKWLLIERCRLIALLGLGGMGKTSLAAKLVRQIQGEFEFVVWRSLKDSPPLKDVISSLIYFLSEQQETEIDLPDSIGARIARLLELLRRHRCLVVLDNAESLLLEGEAGVYREGYEVYGELLKRVGETVHQSCLVLTSREKPREISALEGNTLPVRSLAVSPIETISGQQILKDKGLLIETEQSKELIDRCGGNPLALKLIANIVQELFNGNMAKFLEQGTVVYADIENLLNEHFNRLSDLEKAVMYWLAIHRGSVSVQALSENIFPGESQQSLLNALRGLVGRSLIEITLEGYTQQPVVMEYMTTQLVDRICKEVQSGDIELFNRYALVMAQTKDYLREKQIRLILKPLTDRLLKRLGGESAIANRLVQLIKVLQNTPRYWKGYGGGNIITWLCYLKFNLKGLNFSHLDIRQAYLQDQSLYEVDFTNCDLSESVFAQTFSSILAVAFSPDGELLAIGDATGEIHLQSVHKRQSLLTCSGHINRVRSVVFSPDSTMFASAGDDGIVRVWDTQTRQCIKCLKEYNTKIWSIAFSPNGRIIASGSEDRLIRLWDVETEQCLKTFSGHTGDVLAVSFSPDGSQIASSGCDATIRLWSTDGECIKVFNEHTRWVTSVAFSPNGTILVSSSEDTTLKLWDVNTGKCLKTLREHSDFVFSVAFSPDGKTIASGSRDFTVRLWDAKTGQRLKILNRHKSWVRAIAFSPDSQALASGGDDQILCLWDVKEGFCLKTIEGFTNWVWSVVFSPDGNQLACGSEDCRVRVWDVQTKQVIKLLEGHSQRIGAVAFSPDQKTLASGGDDRTIRLWEVETEKCLRTLEGHTDRIRSIAFSPDGKKLASCGDDCVIRIWDFQTGTCLQTLRGHAKWVWSVAFNPDSTTLVSGSDDCTIRIWNIDNGQCLKILSNDSSWVSSVAFNPDGRTIASGSHDQLIRIWDVSTGQCVATLRGHADRVRSVTFSLDGRTLASSSEDQTIRIWDVSTRHCVKVLRGHHSRVRSVAFSPNMQTIASGGEDATIYLWDAHMDEPQDHLRPERRYERLQIQGTTGLTKAQRKVLLNLGAIDD